MTSSYDQGDHPDELIASIQLSPIAAVITDPRLPDNPVIAVNPAFTALTLYPAEEAIGRNCRFLAGSARVPLLCAKRSSRDGRVSPNCSTIGATEARSAMR